MRRGTKGEIGRLVREVRFPRQTEPATAALDV